MDNRTWVVVLDLDDKNSISTLDNINLYFDQLICFMCNVGL